MQTLSFNSSPVCPKTEGQKILHPHRAAKLVLATPLVLQPMIDVPVRASYEDKHRLRGLTYLIGRGVS